MDNLNTQPNYSGPTTTAESASEGRLKVDVGKRKIIKTILKKHVKNKKRNR